jgi:hypothetical protein
MVGAADLAVTSLSDSGAGSLRATLATAMGNSEADRITFSVSGTIALQTPLPILGDPGCTGAPDCLEIDGGGVILLDGSGIPRPHAEGYGLGLAGPGFTIRNLGFAGFEKAGVLVDGSTAHGNRIVNCTIGTDASGSNVTSNTVVGDAGILVRAAIGTEIAGNAIAGYTPRSESLAAGIHVTGGADGTHIVDNVIGLAASGTAPVAGSGHTMHVGIWIDGAIATMVGAPGAGNVIGNQLVAGILAEGSATTDVIVIGNQIGTDRSGTVEMPNGLGSPESGGGVVIRNGVQAGFIGDPMGRNVISANHDCQVRIDNAGPGIEVFGNIIGAAGTIRTQRLTGYNGAAVSGNVNGVCLEGGAYETFVGRGASPLEANRFAYHDPATGSCPPACGAAVLVRGAGTRMNHIGGNYVGFAFDGEAPTGGATPNHYGVLIVEGAGPNAIGEEPNQITGTTRAAIAVVGSTTRGNAFLHNWVWNNGTGVSPGVEICLARSLTDCRAHGYVSDPSRGNDGVLPPRFDAGAYYLSEPDIALVTGTVTEPGMVYLFRVPPTPSNSGFGGAIETVAEIPVTDAPYTFELPFPIVPGAVECATAVLTTTGTHPNGSELAANVRVVGGDPSPDDDGGPTWCRPTPPTGGDADASTARCSAGFERVDGVCARELGCAAVQPSLAWFVVMIWMRRRIRE